MFELNLVTPQSVIVSKTPVEWVSLPTIKGEQTIHEGHSPMMSTLDTGVLEYQKEDGNKFLVHVSMGFCEVTGESVNVLAEKAERKDDIDIKRSESSLVTIEEKLKSKELTEEEREYWLKKQRKEMSRIEVAKS